MEPCRQLSTGTCLWHEGRQEHALGCSGLETALLGSEKSKRGGGRCQCSGGSFRMEVTAAGTSARLWCHSESFSARVLGVQGFTRPNCNENLAWMENGALRQCLGFQMTCKPEQRRINSLPMYTFIHGRKLLLGEGLDCTALGIHGTGSALALGDALPAEDHCSFGGGCEPHSINTPLGTSRNH